MLASKSIAIGRRLSSALAVLSLLILVGVFATPAKAQGDDAKVEADVHKTLDNKKFQSVSVSQQNGTIVLSGTVADYADKEDADQRVHHVKGVKGVDNEIQVAGGAEVGDQALRDKLAKGLAYDRVGYGTTPFNAITLDVSNGVVTVGGTVYGPSDKDSAISLVEHTAGVKDVIDNLQVAPLSPMDDQLRVRLARVIYGDPGLQKYALDPEKPIRITVVNGNVTLSGVVDNKMDHDLAGVRASTVPGVFKLVNDLQVAGPQPGK